MTRKGRFGMTEKRLKELHKEATKRGQSKRAPVTKKKVVKGS